MAARQKSVGRVLIKSRLFGNRWLPRTTCALRRGFRRFSDGVAPGEKTTARQHQARQAAALRRPAPPATLAQRRGLITRSREFLLLVK